MNSIISWVGGKKALRELIYQRMPREFGRYVEVFGGGGWVLFGKPPDTPMEVYNDFNTNLYNLFRCAKERTFAFLKELGFLPLNGRDEFGVLRKYLENRDRRRRSGNRHGQDHFREADRRGNRRKRPHIHL